MRASVITDRVRLRCKKRYLWLGAASLTREILVLSMKMRGIGLLMIAVFTALPVLATAQTMVDAKESAGTIATTSPAHVDVTYTRPTQKTRLRNYVFDAFGPYPLVAAAAAAGIGQAYNSPPEWRQGAAGYGQRIGSAFGIAAVSTTTLYGLADAFKEDTLYYRCECRGLGPRLGHAVISTLTARRGEDGHRIFSFPALIAPYAGTFTAVYAWYPGRYNGKDALRMGNYTMLGYLGESIAMEFLYRGPNSLLRRMHLNNGREAPSSGSNR